MSTTDPVIERVNEAAPDPGADHYRRQLQTVAENATLALFIMDEQQRCSYMNPAAERLTGFRLEELQGQPLHYYIHHKYPDGRHYPLEECPIDRAFPQNMREQGEETFVHKDGHLYPVSFTASPIRQEGRTVGTIIEAREITEDRRLAAERQQLVDDLRLERARLAELFELAPAFIATLRGPAHVFEMTNQAYLRLVGGRNVVGLPVAEALPEVVEQGFVAILDRVRNTGEPFIGTEVPVVLRNSAGVDEAHFVNFIYQPLTGRGGQIDGIFVHGVDVTDQVRARTQVEELKGRLDLALDSAQIGTWDFDLTANTLIWDNRTRDIFGVPQRGDVSYDVFLSRVHAEDRERADAAVQEALAGTNGGGFEVQYRVIHEDQSCHWVRASGRAFFDSDDTAMKRPTRLTGTVMDVTESVDAERERERLLRETENQKARLQQVFVDAPAIIGMYSGENHTITMVNPMWEKVLGRRNVIGKPVAEVFPEIAGTGLFEMLDEVRATGRPYVGNETEIPIDRTGTGKIEQTWWNFVFQPIGDADGRVTDIFVHAVEVTDQVRARRLVEERADDLAQLAHALEISNRELDQFAYVASHDLKAPLRGISNLSQWIEEDVGSQNLSAETREHLSLLRGRVHRMEALIDGILQYSRAGRVREKPEQVDVKTLVDEVIDLLAPPESVRFEFSVLPQVSTERLPLQQVFQNLIGNAIKYTRREDAAIRISAADSGEHWEFAVADNGPGIAPEYHTKIFGLFQTLEARDKVEATGIGLSIVQKTVDSRGGRVWVESEAGAGTTFRFTWPKKPQQETRPS